MADHNTKYLHTDKDSTTRCWWCVNNSDYIHYHDHEWGRPVVNDYQLFEKICLESFQSGLSWLTILRKRQNFREAFADFNFNVVASFNQDNVAILLQNKGIVRHRGKIEATINNASRAIEMVDEFGSVAAYIWSWEPSSVEPHIGNGVYEFPIPSITKTSQLLSKDLKRRGWKFFGPTTAYAFMQAIGLVNDHIPGCTNRKIIEDIRSEFRPPIVSD
jgi:DNA-3-methyladenine glycosylase I